MASTATTAVMVTMMSASLLLPAREKVTSKRSVFNFKRKNMTEMCVSFPFNCTWIDVKVEISSSDFGTFSPRLQKKELTNHHEKKKEEAKAELLSRPEIVPTAGLAAADATSIGEEWKPTEQNNVTFAADHALPRYALSAPPTFAAGEEEDFFW
jgi:hypothetical protein